MGHTLTIRVSEDLVKWLADTAARTGVSKGQLVRDQLERARASGQRRPFMHLAGSISGARDLSSRKGFSRR